MTGEIFLCVMSDDLGMHPAVNEGIIKAFTDGLLTDANIMAPCPAFHEAAVMAKQVGLPTGFHATLTCDWDRYRWGPLTRGASLVTPEGYLQPHTSLAWDGAKDDEALAEFTAQIAAIEAEGIHTTHSSFHMGYDREGYRLFHALEQIGMERVGPLRVAHNPASEAIRHYQWSTAFFSSDWTTDYPARQALLKEHLKAMQPGYHLWMVHAAIDHPALDALCSADFHARLWARDYRAGDMRLLLDPEIRDLIDALGIRRIPVTAAPLSD